MRPDRPIRVLLAKLGLDAHTIGITVVARALRDAGMELDRAGENYYVTTRPAEEAVAHTLNWFMDDPPHRNNILHEYYTRFGVGVAYRPPGWYIFVLDFAGD